MKPAAVLEIGKEQSSGRRQNIPWAVKVIYTIFVAILVPMYLREYGPTNFLWFCDTALLLTMVGIWLESRLLVSMCAVGILVPQLVWLVDFGAHFLGIRLTGLTDYMFDHNLPLFMRGLSLFHGWLPIVLVWLLSRLGYDQRALPAWGILTSVSVIVCYLFTPPAGAHLANPNIPININNIYGFNNDKPQHLVDQNLYIVLWIAALWLLAFVPTHLILRKVFREQRQIVGA